MHDPGPSHASNGIPVYNTGEKSRLPSPCTKSWADDTYKGKRDAGHVPPWTESTERGNEDLALGPESPDGQMTNKQVPVSEVDKPPVIIQVYRYVGHCVTGNVMSG